MDDLDDLKGRVERATRALTEREAEEQSRHSQLVALVAALEAKSLEAREAKERAEARLAEAVAENDELRGLLVGLLDAVETGSRSRFADAIYALEARVSGQGAMGQDTTGPEPSGLEPSAEHATPEHTVPEPAVPEPAPPDGRAEADGAAAGADSGEEGLDEFTAQLAAACAVEQELEQEAEALHAEAVDGARSLLERIRREVDRPDTPGEAGTDAPAAVAEPAADPEDMGEERDRQPAEEPQASLDLAPDRTDIPDTDAPDTDAPDMDISETGVADSETEVVAATGDETGSTDPAEDDATDAEPLADEPGEAVDTVIDESDWHDKRQTAP